MIPDTHPMPQFSNNRVDSPHFGDTILALLLAPLFFPSHSQSAVFDRSENAQMRVPSFPHHHADPCPHSFSSVRRLFLLLYPPHPLTPTSPPPPLDFGDTPRLCPTHGPLSVLPSPPSHLVHPL